MLGASLAWPHPAHGPQQGLRKGCGVLSKWALQADWGPGTLLKMGDLGWSQMTLDACLSRILSEVSFHTTPLKGQALFDLKRSEVSNWPSGPKFVLKTGGVWSPGISLSSKLCQDFEIWIFYIKI